MGGGWAHRRILKAETGEGVLAESPEEDTESPDKQRVGGA